jgi:short-subunit dehydrogenase
VRLDGARVLLTGASRGIGEATAYELAAAGAIVTLVARRKTALEKVAARVRDHGAEAHVVAADMSKEDAVLAMVAEAEKAMGGIDVLVNNAGLGLSAPVADIEPADLRYVLEVNLIAPHVATRAVLPKMLKRRRGAIVNVGSVASHIATPDLGGYSATKFALKALSDALRMELQGSGVHVTLVCPGPIATEFAESVRGSFPEHYPSRPVGAPASDVGRAIVKAIQRRQAEVFVPAYYQAVVGVDSIAPQLMRVGGKRGMKIATRLAEKVL